MPDAALGADRAQPLSPYRLALWTLRLTRPPGQKPDALALMGCPGGWIVMPEATALSVSMIVSFSAFSPHWRLSVLTDVVGAVDMNDLMRI